MVGGVTRRGRAARSILAVLTVVAVSTAGAAAADDTAADDTATDDTAGDTIVRETPELAPREKRLYMVTDSVGLGARSALPRAFPADWDITLDGDAGEFTETLERNYVAPRISSTPHVFGDHAVVAAGYNYPYWDPGRFDRSVDSMIATLESAGVRYIHWVTLREVKQQYVSPGGWRQIQPYFWYFPEVNDRLEMALERHPNLYLVDFAAVADQPDITYDAIHLNNPGAALYSAIVRESVVNAQTASPDGSILRIPIPDPAGVEAVALNLTTVGPRAPGFLTAFPCDTPLPTLSNHNYGRAQIVAHSVVARVGATGEVCVYVHRGAQVIVDITGRFGAGAGIARGAPERVLDTRLAGGPLAAGAERRLPMFTTAPGAAALSVTAVGSAGPGFVRVAPCGATGDTSTVNVSGPAAVPNLTVVEGSPAAPLCVTASRQMDVVVDSFVPFGETNGVEVTAPERVLDTRTGDAPPLEPGTVVELDGAAPATTGVMLNLTAADARGLGFLTAYPCAAGRPDTSSLNYSPGDVVANFVIVQPDAAGKVCVYTFGRTHVVVDAVGTTTTDFTGSAPQRLLDTRQRPTT